MPGVGEGLARELVGFGLVVGLGACVGPVVDVSPVFSWSTICCAEDSLLAGMPSISRSRSYSGTLETGM
jgi:hypothetical protein